MRAEFDRLSDIFELFCEFERSKMSPAKAAEHRSLIPTPEQMLSQIGKDGTTMSHIIAGVREAINDHNEMLTYSTETGHSFVSEFLAFYKQRTGRDYFDDAGHPKKIARKIIRRGEIIDETEFRLIMGILNNVDQTVFKGDEIDHINKMLFRFESTIRGKM